MNWGYPEIGETRFLQSSMTPRRIVVKRVSRTRFWWRFTDEKDTDWNDARSLCHIEIMASALFGHSARSMEWDYAMGVVDGEERA